jgi:hypothetical protein
MTTLKVLVLAMFFLKYVNMVQLIIKNSKFSNLFQSNVCSQFVKMSLLD